MLLSSSFNQPSLPMFGGISILLVLIALGAGNFIGHRSARNGQVSETSTGSAVAAILGLLAFMLAFTFNSTAERFGERKALLLNEVNAIATTYLRADLLPVNERKKARALLAEYSEIRDIDPKDTADFESRMTRSKAIHNALWHQVAVLSNGGFDAVKLGQFMDPLNAVIDFDTSRIFVGSRYRIPPPIWGALFAVTALAMFGIGFQLGAGRQGSPQIALALALAFSVVILLIADLDRSWEGLLTVEQTPMSELNKELQAEQSKPDKPN